MKTGEVAAEAEVNPNASQDVVRIVLLQVPGCPLVGQVREMLRGVLARCDVRAEIEEQVGEYPSPTLLVDGRDVTGRHMGERSACRLDLPTEEQVLAALRSPGGTASEERSGL